jgi:hypothetical protein
MRGVLSPEDAAAFQQETIAPAELVDAVPERTRQSFDRLRNLHSYGVLCYDAFTVAGDLTMVVLEQALRERFVGFYSGRVPLIDKRGTTDELEASDFEAVNNAFRRGGSHYKGGWKLVVSDGRMSMPLTLSPLLTWAHRECLLIGRRNRWIQEAVYGEIRNHFAHGAGYHVAMPNNSSRHICNLAEIINRLWGHSTPGGRLYPAPLRRETLALGWSSGWPTETGSAFSVMTAKQLLAARDRGHWTYLIVLASPDDEMLRAFHSAFDRTVYPARTLWGPGPYDEAAAWVGGSQLEGDNVEYLDRVFALRQHGDEVDAPRSPEAMLGLPADYRSGTWRLIRADIPGDAWVHARHVVAGEPCKTLAREHGCPVQTLAEGPWDAMVAVIAETLPGIEAADYTAVGVPQ